MTEKERTNALQVVTSVITRCERMVPKFAPGTPQYTLLKNRIQAMKIAKGLLTGHGAELYTTQEMSAALEPLASIIRKCKKAQSKYEPGSGQHGRFNVTIRAMELSQTLIEDEFFRRSL